MISLIAAVGQNRAIGVRQELVWNMPSDMAHFRKTTQGHTVIMGRKTLDSIGLALPNRRNIVLSRQNLIRENVEIANSIEEALAKCSDRKDEEIFVIGGGEIYAAALPYASKVILTDVDDSPVDCDTFFPMLKSTEWYLSQEGEWQQGAQDQCRFRILIFERITN